MGQLLLVFIVGLMHQSLSATSAEEMFCVEPTASTTKCPCSDSRCHPLEDYVSSFTSNSRFFFMEGEHHLNSSVNIRNVANLSLVGASPRAKIVCKSSIAGFHIEQFTRLKISNLTVSDCNGVTLMLQSGSEVSLSQISISSSFEHDAAGLKAFDILGSFSITYSTFTSGSEIIAQYYERHEQSLFEFSNNQLVQLKLLIYCSNVQIRLMDSTFKNEVTGVNGLEISFMSLSNNSILVGNSTFRRADIYARLCADGSCSDNIDCRDNFMKLTGVSSTSPVYFKFGRHFPVGCNINIEDSIFTDSPPSHYTPTVIFESSIGTADTGSTPQCYIH